MLGGYGGGWVVAMTPLLIPFSTAAVVPMTPIMYSSAKLKHQTLSRERHASAAHATTSKAVPNAVAGKSGLRLAAQVFGFHDGEVDPLPRCKRLLGR